VESINLSRIVHLCLLVAVIFHTPPTLGVDYLSEIKPILAEKCYPCHGALKQESELRLETRDLMLNGGDSGSVLDLTNPENSLIVHRVTTRDGERMPPEGEGSPLSGDQIKMLLTWIRQGAVTPDERTPVAPAEHWAFQSLNLEAVTSEQPDKNLIDTLLTAKHITRGITPLGQASKPLQIRRLYLDLIGLPPTAEQLSDQRTIGEIANELLDNPHHGERWARHWMDVWRYSDWYGLGEQLRNSQKHLWHWRDWIIQSLNEDKGYDQMIQEMLAGDELSPDDPNTLAATGFLARNYYLFNRTTWLDSTIEHTSKAFLGLTINCAKCHDHKYDPISHVDYYRMRAIFEPHQVRLDPVPGVIDFEQDGLPRVFDDHLDASTYLHLRGDPKNPDTEIAIEAGIPSIFSDQQPTISQISLPSYAFAPATRSHIILDQTKRLDSEIASAEKELINAKEKLKSHQHLQAKGSTTDEENSRIAEQENFMLVERFDKLDPDRWELVGDNWEVRDGMLHQTSPTRESHFAKLKTQIPKNFEANCFYTHQGGTTYRSVTFRFDESPDQQNSNYVYSSAHAPGPKVQVAFTRNGQSTYPTEGRKAQSIQEGKRYHLRFALKEKLINVWLDGVLVIAYQFPDRLNGNFSLSGFDSTVSFDELTIQSLSEEIEWTTPKDFKSEEQDVEKLVNIAEAKVQKLRAEKESIATAIRADKAVYSSANNGTSDNPTLTQPLRLEAAKAQQRLRIAEATLENLQSDKDLSDKIKQAKEKLEQLTQSPPEQIEYASFKATRKALESPADKEADYPATYVSSSTGRRKSLAQWITSEKNPLTARVAVNHVWMRHFGEPLVESVFDFGLRAKPPVHQDILDALAIELIRSDWSLKHIHRIIVTSDAYLRSTSTQDANPHSLGRDPENQYYWKMNAKRMESQLLRDSLLFLSDQLDLTIGGPSLAHNHQPPRRGLYLRHSPDVKDSFLETFDNANVLDCYRRSESIVPQQALAMVNSQLSLSSANQLNQKVHVDHPDLNNKEFVETIFQLLLARTAGQEEFSACISFLDQLTGQSVKASETNAVPLLKAREHLIHSLLNHHEFITIR